VMASRCKGGIGRGGGVVTFWEGHGSVSRDARWRCHVGCHCQRHHGEDRGDQPCSASRLWFLQLRIRSSSLPVVSWTSPSIVVHSVPSRELRNQQLGKGTCPRNEQTPFPLLHCMLVVGPQPNSMCPAQATSTCLPPPFRDLPSSGPRPSSIRPLRGRLFSKQAAQKGKER
jgi:hypothetical protein